jgi:hypothetical protein
VHASCLRAFVFSSFIRALQGSFLPIEPASSFAGPDGHLFIKFDLVASLIHVGDESLLPAIAHVRKHLHPPIAGG